MAVPVGVVGATGYTGGELLRLLLEHPKVEVVYAASRGQHGTPLAEVQPHLAGWTSLKLEPLDPEAIARRCQVVFTAVPKGAAMEMAPAILAAGAKMIDIGTDFRFRDRRIYEEWYGLEHTQPDLLAESVYGLPELFRKEVAGARLVGNPGCYPTATLLAVAPLVAQGLARPDDIIVTAMSGVSGAGREPRDMYHLPHAIENVQPYGVVGHRHIPEMEQGVRRLVGGATPRVSFTPHLVPMSRGILSTVVLVPTRSLSPVALQEACCEFYRGEPFVRVLPPDRLPQTKAVLGSNRCDVAYRLDERAGRIIAMAAIDNLGKGAAGQAVQNMNVMMGWDETTGLRRAGVYP